MPAIEATKTKLAEADFFYRKLADLQRRVVSNEPEAFGYYLSAFVSAARSVPWVLQAERKEEYDEWLPDWEKSLSDDDRALWTHFNEQRIATIKRKGVEVTHRFEAISHSEYFLAVAREGAKVHIIGGVPGTPLPQFFRRVGSFKFGGNETEVVQTCAKYLALMSRLVQSFVARFGAT